MESIVVILGGSKLLGERSSMDYILLLDFVQKLPPIAGRILITKWCFLALGKFKINTDGCYKGNPSPAGGGCVLRNDQSKFVWAIADYFGCTTNMTAYMQALLQGVQRCKAKGIVNLDVETDSLILVYILKGKLLSLSLLFMKLDSFEVFLGTWMLWYLMFIERVTK